MPPATIEVLKGEIAGGASCQQINFPEANFMGRPYSTELAKLSDTICWAFSHHIEPLQAFFDHARTKPLISVGVGGSSTAALFATLLHRERGKVSHTVTTLDFLMSRAGLSQSGVLLFTACGNNKDILSAVETGAMREPSQISIRKLRCVTKQQPGLCWRSSTAISSAIPSFYSNPV